MATERRTPSTTTQFTIISLASGPIQSSATEFPRWISSQGLRSPFQISALLHQHCRSGYHFPWLCELRRRALHKSVVRSPAVLQSYTSKHSTSRWVGYLCFSELRPVCTSLHASRQLTRPPQTSNLQSTSGRSPDRPSGPMIALICLFSTCNISGLNRKT